ncbi:hypothetical protein [Variovorax saccharolyticus]|uniref:hypothetical protein n=1 Tax=Variovorax saccharolyticus TaxID=3053516 RepID=UPI002578E587|nr:hypothetical protein [Variovorax sp. J22R187]MDM0018017.1 hypothetical protein [Variovorax sp. J22R187]
MNGANAGGHVKQPSPSETSTGLPAGARDTEVGVGDLNRPLNWRVRDLSAGAQVQVKVSTS